MKRYLATQRVKQLLSDKREKSLADLHHQESRSKLRNQIVHDLTVTRRREAGIKQFIAMATVY